MAHVERPRTSRRRRAAITGPYGAGCMAALMRPSSSRQWAIS